MSKRRKALLYRVPPLSLRARKKKKIKEVKIFRL